MAAPGSVLAIQLEPYMARLEEQEQLAKDSGSRNSMGIADSYSEIAHAHLLGCDYETAHMYFKLSLQMRNYLLGSEANGDIKFTETLNDIGSTLCKRHYYKLGMDSLFNALDNYRAIHGEGVDNVAIAMTCNNIGVAFCKQCRYPEALEYHENALSMLTLLPAASGMDLALVYKLTGDCYLDQCQFDVAMGQYQTATAFYEDLFDGSEMSEYVAVEWILLQCKIGLTYHQMGFYEKAFKKYNAANTFVCEYFPDQQVIIKMEMFNGVGDINTELGEYDTALKSYMLALKVCGKYYGQNRMYQPIADCFNKIASVNVKKWLLDDSIKRYTAALHICENIYGDDSSHPELAKNSNFFGSFLRETSGWYAKALVYHSKALTMYRDLYGMDANHKDISTTYSYIGIIYCDIGDCNRAHEYHRKSLEMNQQLYGDSNLHPCIIENHIDIGNVLMKEGEFQKAVDYYEQALNQINNIYTKCLANGGSHKDVVRVSNLIGVAYRELGLYSQSKDMHFYAIDICGKVFKNEDTHPVVTASRIHVADLFFAQEQYKIAIMWYEIAFRCYLDFDTKYNTRGIWTLKACLKVGLTFHRLGLFEKARNTYTQSLALVDQLSTSGPESHPQVAALKLHVGDFMDSVGRLEQAIDMYQGALTIYESVFNEYPDQPVIASCLFNLGRMYYQAARYQESLQSYIDCATTRKNSAARGQPIEIAHCFDGAGNASLGMDKYEDAKKHYSKSLEMKQNIHKDNFNHHDIAESYTLFGQLNNAQRDHATALEYHTKALDINKAILGEHHSKEQIGKCYDNLGITYCLMGQWQQAHAALQLAIDNKTNAYQRAKLMRFELLGVNEAETEKVNEITIELQAAYFPSLAMTHCYIGNAHYFDGISIHHIGPNESVRKEKFHSALDSYKQAATILEDVYGQDRVHQDIATVHNNMGLVLQQKSIQDTEHDTLYQFALNEHLLALDMREQIYGANSTHISITISYNNVGYIHCLRGEYEEAMHHLNAALVQITNSLGTDAVHPETANIHENIGTIHYEKEEYNEALQEYKIAHKIRAAIYGKFEKYNSALFSSNLNLANVYDKLGKTRESRQCRDLANSISIPSASDGQGKRSKHACAIM